MIKQNQTEGKNIKYQNKYMVLLVDRKKARMFTFTNNQIEEHRYIVDDSVPQNVRANERDFYGRSDKIFNHIEDHLHRHLKIIAEGIVQFAHGKSIKFILIGGHREMFEKVKKHLPKNLRNKVVGEFVAELNIPIDKIFIIAKKELDKIEQKKSLSKLEDALRGDKVYD